MNAEELRKTFPKVFAELSYPGMVSLPKGWEKLVSNLVADLNSLSIPVHVHQIKEKFGTLRFHASWPAEESREKRIAIALIHEAERASNYICESCGERGWLRENLRWILVLCDTCLQKHIEEDPKRLRGEE